MAASVVDPRESSNESVVVENAPVSADLARFRNTLVSPQSGSIILPEIPFGERNSQLAAALIHLRKAADVRFNFSTGTGPRVWNAKTLRDKNRTLLYSYEGYVERHFNECLEIRPPEVRIAFHQRRKLEASRNKLYRIQYGSLLDVEVQNLTRDACREYDKHWAWQSKLEPFAGMFLVPPVWGVSCEEPSTMNVSGHQFKVTNPTKCSLVYAPEYNMDLKGPGIRKVRDGCNITPCDVWTTIDPEIAFQLGGIGVQVFWILPTLKMFKQSCVWNTDVQKAWKKARDCFELGKGTKIKSSFSASRSIVFMNLGLRANKEDSPAVVCSSTQTYAPLPSISVEAIKELELQQAGPSTRANPVHLMTNAWQGTMFEAGNWSLYWCVDGHHHCD